MQMKKDYSTADLARIDHSRVDAAVGPVYVDGAEKGDTLKIDNGYISLLRGHMRLNVGKYGSMAEAEEGIEPSLISLT